MDVEAVGPGQTESLINFVKWISYEITFPVFQLFNCFQYDRKIIIQ